MIAQYVTDANNWLAGITKAVNTNGQTSLSLLFDDSDAKTSAFTWVFDQANPTLARTS